MSWLTAFTKHPYKKVKGAHNAMVLAIWTMFSNSGKVPVSLVLQTLQNVKSPEKRKYSDILVNADVRFAINYITALRKQGADWDPGLLPANLSGFSSPARERAWFIEDPQVRLALSDPLMKFLKDYSRDRASS